MLQRKAALKRFNEEELADIEADLDQLEALLRKSRGLRCSAPAAGGETLTLSGRTRSAGLRPRPAAFAYAVAVLKLEPLAAAAHAGYRAPNRMTAWRLQHDPKVRAEIERLKEERVEKHDER